MKPVFAILALLVVLPLSAATTLTMGHVYDVGKGAYSSDENVTDTSDRYLCWAYSAANLLQYWQDYYLGAADEGETPANGLSSTAYTSPKGTQYLSIADVFRDNWTDAGGWQRAAFQWWFQGTDAVDSTCRPYLEEKAIEAGYYQTLFGSDVCYNLQVVAYQNEDNAKALMDFIDANAKVAGQGIGLAIALADNAGGHAITCWGYEKDADGNLTALYITDSDDRYYGTVRLDVLVQADGTLKLSSNDLSSYFSESEYYLLRAESIATPSKAAVTATLQTELPSSGTVAENICFSTDYKLTSDLTVSEEAVLTSSGGSLSITGGSLALEEGSMASLSDLSRLSLSNSTGAGLALAGKAYVSRAGEVAISGNSAYGIDNSAYLELNGCGPVSISNNSFVAASGAEAQGGGISNRMTLSMLGNDSLTVENNTATGGVAAGGGMLTLASYCQSNGAVTFSGNVATGTSYALGGAVYSFYVNDISLNDRLTFSNNSVTASGSNAQALGGAVMQGAMSSTGTGFTTISGNGAVVFSDNSAAAADGYALGGAIFVSSAGTAELSGTTEHPQSLTFSGNSATGAFSAGGALAGEGTTTITGNTAVSFEKNKATYGSAVFNSGTMSITDNGAVTVTDNISGNGGAIQNAGTMEIAWNDSFSSSGNTASVNYGSFVLTSSDSDILNAGTLYLAAEEGKSLTLGNGLYNKGITYLGRDIAGTTGTGTLNIASTVLSAGSAEGGVAELVSCSVTGTGIEGLETTKTATLRNLDILTTGTDSSYSLTSLNLCQDCSVSAAALTLSDVVLVYDDTVTARALCYTVDVTSVFSGAVSGDVQVQLSNSLLAALYAQNCLEVTVDFGEEATLQSDSDVSLNNGYRTAKTDHTVTFVLPEPATAALSLFALSALACRRRR